MSTAKKIFQKAQALPEPAQDKLLEIAEEMASQMLNSIRNFLRIDDRMATSGMPQPEDFAAL